MRLRIYHKVDQPETEALAQEVHRTVMRALGYPREDLVEGTIPFYFGAQLLHAVHEKVYAQYRTPGEDYTTYRMGSRYWMTDDFRVFVNPDTNEPVFYLHFAHGDCDYTYFTVNYDSA